MKLLIGNFDCSFIAHEIFYFDNFIFELEYDFVIKNIVLEKKVRSFPLKMFLRFSESKFSTL